MNDVIVRIKEFNRFYTRFMDLYNLYRDGSSYSAVEAMILFEIFNYENCTAAHLSTHFLVDKGYISRILKKFEEQELIRRVVSEEDRRIHYLELTVKGGEDLHTLTTKASLRVEQMIEGLTKEDIKLLIESMQTIERLFCEKNE